MNLKTKEEQIRINRANGQRGRKHTKESIEKMKRKKREWWVEIKKNPEKLEQVKRNIGESSKGRIKGGKEHPSWKGGRYISKRDGYVYLYCPEHPFAKTNSNGGGGYVLEHRLVMEKVIGRYLKQNENVHHKNGIKDDNREENLMIVSHYKHYEEHGCPKCGFKFLQK